MWKKELPPIQAFDICLCMRQPQPPKQIEIIYFIKCIGIILIVFVHYTPEMEPLYLKKIHDAISSFMMPVFFVISGYLLHLSLERKKDIPLRSLVIDKCERLGLPFLSVATLSFIIKYISGFFFKLHYPLTLHSFISIFISPADSYKPSLWFLYALLLLDVSFLFILKYVKNITVLLLLTVILHIVSPNVFPLFCLDAMAKNAVFLVFGYWFSQRADITDFFKRYKKAVLLPVLLFWVTFHLQGGIHNHILYNMANLILGTCGICIMCCTAAWWLDWRHTGLLHAIGYYSMSIYLFHTFFISFFRIMLYHVYTISKTMFLPGAVLAITAGLVGPLLLEKYVLRRFAITRRYMLGLRPGRA